MSKPQPAAPPDPVAISQAQTASNKDTAQYQQQLNMVNTNGPGGSVSYAADPTAPGGYSQNTVLSPGQQGIYDKGVSAQSGALGVANDQIKRVSTALSQGLDPSGVQTGVGVRNTYDQGGPIQRSVGNGDFNQSMQKAADAVYGQETSRLDPQWALARQQSDAQLANQGLGANSTAYQNAKAILGRNQNDAYASAQNDAITASQAVQAQGYGQDLSSGQFANSAQLQQNQENAAAAGFYNQANLAAATFGNQANAQQFQQNAYSQELPINEFNSLMSSNQVGMPTGVNYTPTQVAGTDVLGANALNAQYNQSNYQAQMANNAGLMGGLAKLGGAAIMASDVRLKEDIRRVGTLDSGLPIYTFRYKGSLQPQMGVMAQEAAVTHPHAVVKMPSGFLGVDYGALS